MSHLRKQICLDFAAAGLSVSQVEVDQGVDLASACVTVDCPAGLRPALMDQARRLRDHPDVRCVRFGQVRRPVAA